MFTRKLFQVAFAMMALAVPLSAQGKESTPACVPTYENRNQVDYGPLVVHEVKGTVAVEQQRLPKVCVAVFTEKDHQLVASAETNSDGDFSVRDVEPGLYRLVVKVDAFCVANVPLKVVKHGKTKAILQVHMRASGIDSCSGADLGER